MARKPDGKPAKVERVTFTRPAAERIAKVVREVEAGDRDQAGITFGTAPGAASGKVFRVCTFTGAWSIGSEKTVTFRGVTTTPNTVSVVNLTMHLPAVGTATAFDCSVAKDGTAWYLVAAEEHNVRRGTFTPPWPKNTTIEVSLDIGGTVVVSNQHASITGTGTKKCAVARIGMGWELIAAEC